ncbi:TonB-dependent receptor [Parahaliea aestuarii]
MTANKREQSIQDVSIAMTAFSGAEIADYGWSDVTQIANQAPNVDIKYAWGNSMPIYTIRGVGMNSFQASDTPSVGLFIDEVFQTSLVSMGAQLFDMERVEVLKGPQGALFGRNTNGGAISYLSAKPGQEAEGFVRADYGKFDRLEVEAAYGGPISDTVSARTAIYSIQQGEGYVHDRTSGKDLGEVDINAGRLQLRWQPSDFLDANLKIYGSRDRSQPSVFQHIGFWSKDFAGGVPGANQYCSSFAAGRAPNPSECVDVLGYSDTDGRDYAGDYTNRLDTPINAGAKLKNDSYGATLAMDFNFDSFTLTSITNFQQYDRSQPKESDANPLLFVDLVFNSDVSQQSQELRITSATDGPVSWIAGIILSNDEVSESPPRTIYADDYLGVRASVDYTQDRDSYAAYAQADWRISDEWALSVGGRWIDESIEFEEETAFLFPPDFSYDERLVLVTIPAPAFGVDGKLDSSEPTWRVALDYTPTEEILAYASVSRGYKGGGFNAGLITNPRLALPFDPEQITAYELGVKSQLIDNRVTLNAALFYYDYSGLQAATPQFDPVAQSPLNFLTNLDDAKITGFEAELDWAVSTAFRIQAGLGWLDTENNDPGVNFDGVFGRAPRVLPNAPEYNFNLALTYDIDLSSGARVRFFGDYVWQDDHYKEIVNNLEVDSQYQVNSRITWLSPDSRYSLSLWGKNLTDEVFVHDTLTDPVGSGWGVYVNGMPRTYGVSAKYNFL